MCIDGKCVEDNIGAKCDKHMDCHGLAKNVACVGGVCKALRALGDFCGAAYGNGECAPPMQCVSGRCQGTAVGTSCTMPSTLETCGSMLACANSTCQTAASIGNHCNSTIPCQPSLFCTEKGVCMPYWSLRPGDYCQTLDQCVTSATCDTLQGTCKSLPAFPKAYESCRSSDDCPAGSICNCMASGKMLCEYLNAVVLSQVMQEIKRQTHECLVTNGCSTDIQGYILAYKEEWSCARKYCNHILVPAVKAFYEAYGLVFGGCIDHSGYSTGGANAAGIVFGVLFGIGALGAIVVGTYFFVKRGGLGAVRTRLRI
jgi:hypothetical protein